MRATFLLGTSLLLTGCQTTAGNYVYRQTTMAEIEAAYGKPDRTEVRTSKEVVALRDYVYTPGDVIETWYYDSNGKWFQFEQGGLLRGLAWVLVGWGEMPAADLGKD